MAIGWTPEPVDVAGHLDAGVGGEVGDEPVVVHHVAHDPGAARRSALRMRDHRRVLAAALDLERLAGIEPALGVLVLVEVVGDPLEVLADRDVEAARRGRPWG